ncbi:MAG: ribonuclease HI family protein [Elusimicrobia bacterium]|nr:ribonuclease HI family protein [Elusimicrobiota bacterium]
MTVSAYIDGASRGNPGPASVGVIVRGQSGETLREHGRTLGTATNNVAEYTAFLDALRIAKSLGADEVLVHSDSLLLVEQIAGKYKVKNAALQGLKAQALALMKGFKAVRLVHVRRELNGDADRLANEALDGRRDDQPLPGPASQGLLF